MARTRAAACLFACSLRGLVCYSEESTQELRAKADAVLEQTNVSARSQVEVVFQLADRLIAEKRQDEAEGYLLQGLQLFPWNLNGQIRYAELLNQKGDAQKAKEKAALVLENGETDELSERARKILGHQPPDAFSAISALPGADCRVVLVPLQGCDNWLIRRVQAGLASELHVPVHIQTAALKEVACGRDRRQKIIAGMRRQLQQNLNVESVSEGMSRLGLKVESLDDDDLVVKLMRHVVSKENGKEAVSKLVALLQEARGKDPQWDADQLLALLSQAADACRRENVAYVGLTPNDIYANDFNFLFGWSNSRGAIVSYRRFTADFSKEQPNRERLVKRTLMQCLSSVGHVYGIARCTDPTCARAYPNSLSEHDAKKGTLCSECRDNFRARKDE